MKATRERRKAATSWPLRRARPRPTPYLIDGDAARSVRRRVGRVVEHTVPVQRPQPDVGEEEKSRNDQPGDLQQPLLSPPHVSVRKCDQQQRRRKLASAEAPLCEAETTFTGGAAARGSTARLTGFGASDQNARLFVNAQLPLKPQPHVTQRGPHVRCGATSSAPRKYTSSQEGGSFSRG